MKAMTTRLNRRGALGLALTAVVPLAVGGRIERAAAEPAAGTWMHAGNAARTGVFPGPGPDVSKDIVELWRIDGQRQGWLSSPCGVCDGIAYYIPVPDGIDPTPRPIVAVDAESGSELWRQDPPILDPPAFFWGKPAIADGLFVMPTRGGLLVGLDAKSGEERWVFDLQGETGEPNPAIIDGVLYVSDNASVNAIKVGDTSEWLWKATLTDGLSSVVSGTVSVDGEYLVISSVSPGPGPEVGEQISDIHVLNTEDGAELYRFRFGGGQSLQFALDSGIIYGRTDIFDLNRSFFFGMTIDGTELWSNRTWMEDRPNYPVVDGDLMLFHGGNAIWRVDTLSGESVWSSPELQMLDLDFLLIDDVIYAGARPGGQMLYALSPRDGSLLKAIDVPFNGAQVIGATNGILVVRSGVNLVAYANLR